MYSMYEDGMIKWILISCFLFATMKGDQNFVTLGELTLSQL